MTRQKRGQNIVLSVTSLFKHSFEESTKFRSLTKNGSTKYFFRHIIKTLPVQATVVPLVQQKKTRTLHQGNILKSRDFYIIYLTIDLHFIGYSVIQILH